MSILHTDIAQEWLPVPLGLLVSPAHDDFPPHGIFPDRI